MATKAKKLDSYVCFALAKHMDINMMHFGDTIWWTVLQPSLSHAAGVWFDAYKQTTNMLQCIEYQFARAVLKIICMPSETSTLGELGCLQITDHLDIIRIAYFIHLQKMDSTHLTKIVYNELQTQYMNNNWNLLHLWFWLWPNLHHVYISCCSYFPLISFSPQSQTSKMQMFA